ncbi:MAG TPA: GntR family transcriptional regulator [Gemmatimonadaceae bacterium]|jgi:GntR family transcriptional regulator
MLPFAITLRPGESPYRQVVYAATRAVVSGELAPGSRFPSVRELSQALRINPNTAQKAVAELTRDGLLEVRPGIGTVVAEGRRRPSAAEKRHLLSAELEKLLVEARRLGVSLEELHDAVEDRWDSLFGPDAGVGR